MNGRLENIQKQMGDSKNTGTVADVRYLVNRLHQRDRIISSLAPKQWKSIASRVPPGRAEEREALREIAHLAEELREEREGAFGRGRCFRPRRGLIDELIDDRRANRR
jgi:hypothetical protein